MADSNFNPGDFEDLIDWNAYGSDHLQQDQIDIQVYGRHVNTGFVQNPEDVWQDHGGSAFNDWLTTTLGHPPASSGHGTINPAELSTTLQVEQPIPYSPDNFQLPQSYSQAPNSLPQANLPANVSTKQDRQPWNSGADNDQDLAQTLDPQLLSDQAWNQTTATPTVPQHSTAFQTPHSPRSILDTGLPTRPPATPTAPPSNANRNPRQSRSIFNTGLPIRSPTTTTPSSGSVYQASYPQRSILGTGLPTRSASTATNNHRTQRQNLSFPTPASTHHSHPSNPHRPETDTPSKQRPKKAHPCTWEGCGRTFAGPHNVKQHVREAHTGERPYRCPECYQAGVDKAFARPGSLNRHRKDLHGMAAGPGRGNVKRGKGREDSVQTVAGRGGSDGGPGAPLRNHPVGHAAVFNRCAPVFNRAVAPQTPFTFSGEFAEAPWRRQEALVDGRPVADASSIPTPMNLEPGQIVYDTIESPDLGSPLSPSDDFEQVAKALRRRHNTAQDRSSVPVASTLAATSFAANEQIPVSMNENHITSNDTFEEHADDDVVYQGTLALSTSGFVCFYCDPPDLFEGTQKEILAHMHTDHGQPVRRLCSCGACSLLYPRAGDAGTEHAELLNRITITPPAAGGDTAPRKGGDSNAAGLDRGGRGGARLARSSDASSSQA